MKKLALIFTNILLLTLLPIMAMGETWICAYKVYGEAKPTQFERTPKGFKSSENIFSILSETDRRITLVDEYKESVFITILDKKYSEFISSAVFAPAQLRRGGAKMDTHKFAYNHGKCEILD